MIKSEFQDYWNELREVKQVQEYLDDLTRQYDDGEEEAEWLCDVGLNHFVDNFQQSREISEKEMNSSLKSLIKPEHAEAVKRRIMSLNNTIRNNSMFSNKPNRHKNRKPNVKDVFSDQSHTNETADLLDSMALNNKNFRRKDRKDICTKVCPELFRKPNNWDHGIDIATNISEGIELIAYQRFGTLNRSFHRKSRSESDPSLCSLTNDDNKLGLHYKNKKGYLSHESVSIKSNEHMSFEEIFKISDKKKIENFNFINNVHVDYLSDYEICHLKPLLWLELSILFDKYSIEFHKRKPCRRKQKLYGNVFGVSLSTLVMRDRRITNDNSTVPQIFQILINELVLRCLKHEGLLRVACQKQKVEHLFDEIEQHFYTNHLLILSSIKQAKPHELTAILKKLLKDLPEPLITRDLINLFFNIHHIPNEIESLTALNYLVLLLPLEHRNTLLIFMNFLSKVIDNEQFNKMSVHNVAMIVAPTIFPPRYLYDSDAMDLNIQISIAATSCHIVEKLITYSDVLWYIPSDLFYSMNQKIKNNVRKKNC